MRPVVALLTDFGLRDHYVGAMKGVVLGICPDAALVDITHDIEPHDILAGSFELASCFRYFPAGTVFLAVVDPGVGSARRPIAIAADEYRFVAPDNGLLTGVVDQAPPRAIVELSAPRYARETAARTFDGRDRFAPAAAWLASGLAIDELGPRVERCVRLDLPVPSADGDFLDGEVVRVDRFGNLVTNIGSGLLEQFAGGDLSKLVVRVGSCEAGRLVATYADGSRGDVRPLIGSTGHLEVSVILGSAAERLAFGRGARVSVRRTQDGQSAEGDGN